MNKQQVPLFCQQNQIQQQMTQLFHEKQSSIHQTQHPYLKLHSQQLHTRKQLENVNQSEKNKITEQSALMRQQEQSKKTRFLIKLNKNIENAFPLNFFSNPTTNKNQTSKKYYSAHKNHLKVSLESMNHHSKQTEQSQAVDIKSNQRYQSIQVQPVSETVIFKPSSQRQAQNITRYRSSRSLQTSIQRQQIKDESSFLFDKEKDPECNILPKTAATLENLDSEDLFNITFGNGWNKSKQQGSQNNHDQSVIFTKNNSKQSRIFRLRNVQSLELKKPCMKSLQKRQELKLIIAERSTSKEVKFLRSERKSVTNHFKKQKVFKMYNSQDSSENHFLKLKLNVDEIVKKKITVLPKMKIPLADFSKKEKLNKLMKLVF